MTRFNEQKTAQLAAYLLQKSDGTLFLIKLIKLIYIADRETFRCLGRPISYDRFVSMEHGPVPSHTYNLTNGAVQGEGYWSAMIAPRAGHKLSVTDESEVGFGALSEAELKIADNVFTQYGHVPRFDLVEITHQFEEWNDPRRSSSDITYKSILHAVGFSEEDANNALDYHKEQHDLSDFFNAA